MSLNRPLLSIVESLCLYIKFRNLSSLTLLWIAASFLQSVLPVIQLDSEGTSKGSSGLGIRHLNYVDVTVGGAEVTAV